MKRKTNFIKIIQVWGIIFLMALGMSFVAIDGINSYRDFRLQADRIRTDFTDRQKQLVKQEVERVVDLIRYEKTQSETLTKKKIESRVYEAYSIAQYIYQQNQDTQSKTEVQRMILDALRPIRFENGNGYYFITRLDGVEVLFADRPEMEGSNLLNMQDIRGQYVIRDMIKIAEQSGEGFYDYLWTKPGKVGNDFKKISFIKRFEPYDWFIGTGLYVDDVESQIKANLLSAISRIRFGKEGYIFVNKFNGDALVSNGTLLPGTKKLWEVFDDNPEKMKGIFEKEYHAALKPEGDFIYYSHIKLTKPNEESPKVSFVYGIPDMHWLVGAGVYLDDVEADIARMQAELTNQMEAKIIYFVLITTFLIGLFTLFFSWLSHRLKSDMNIFVSFFKRAAHSDEEMERENIKFIELDQMAEYANKMLMDRKQAEEALRESEQKYRFITENVRDVILATDQYGNYTYISPSHKLILDRGEEVIGRSVFDHIHLDDLDRVKMTFARGLENGEDQKIEFRYQHPGKGYIWLESVGKRYLNAQGSTTALITSRDITERKRAEEALRTSHERFLTVLDSIDATIYVADMETDRILFMNKKMIESFGRDMTGEICWDVFRGGSRRCPHCTNDQLIDTNGKPTGACVWTGKNPITKKWYMNHDRAIQWEDGRMVKLQIATNITDLRRMEEDLRHAHKMEAVGTLAGGIAHEFNNILGIVLGNAELATDDIPEWNPARFNLNEIKSASFRAKDIVRQLLTFSRKTEEYLRPLDLVPVIKEAIKFLKPSIPSNIEIRQNIAEQCHTVTADPTQIHQVMLNLSTNAAHAMEEKGGILEFSLANVTLDETNRAFDSKLQPGEFVMLQVRDTGHGIPVEFLDRIFDPYFTTKEVGKGSGMGLAVVHGIVKSFGGSIRVESDPGNGTTFKILFPGTKGEARPIEHAKQELPTGTEQILFVDDEKSIATLGGLMLDRLGYRVQTETDPKRAMEIFASGPDRFDLVITDMTMPGMTGDQLIKEIVRIRPDMKCILCTGYSQRVDEEEAYTIGATGYALKPLDRKQLAIIVRKILDERT